MPQILRVNYYNGIIPSRGKLGKDEKYIKVTHGGQY